MGTPGTDRGRPLALGLIGMGAIGLDVLEMIRTSLADRISVKAVLVRTPRTGPGDVPVTHDPERFLAHCFDAVLEGAGHAAVRDHGERILASGADLIVTSVGAFADDDLYRRCVDAAERTGARLIIPSAGIGALDTLSAAAVGGLDSVHMVVRKDPSAWYGTHAEEEHDLAGLAGPTVIFEGTPREGALLYPQNVNISAAVSLAGLGLDRTRLTIIADPQIDTHVCEVHACGSFGSFSFREDIAVSPTKSKDRADRRHGGDEDDPPTCQSRCRRRLTPALPDGSATMCPIQQARTQEHLHSPRSCPTRNAATASPITSISSLGASTDTKGVAALARSSVRFPDDRKPGSCSGNDMCAVSLYCGPTVTPTGSCGLFHMMWTARVPRQ